MTETSTSFVKGMRESGNPLLWRVSVIAATGGLLFGYDTGVISGALLYIRDDLDAGTFEQQAIVSSLLLGAVVGAIAAGYLADRISRKWTIIVSGCVFVAGALGCAFSVSAEMLVGFRFMLGLAVGTASFVAPLYISETAPPRVRGGLVSFNQLAITSGILLAYLVNFAFKDLPENWRWMLGVAAVPGLVLALGMLTVPRTPRWLVHNNQEDKARDVLTRLREGDPEADVEEEMTQIKEADRQEKDTRARDLVKPTLRPLLLIGLGLALFQQFVGINTVIYYAPTILADTGLTKSASITQTVFVGVTNVVFTVVAVLLLDRVGRRPLLLIGVAGLIVSLVTLGVYFTSSTLQEDASYLALVALLVYIASFAIGLGPVFWLMIAEIYPIGVRSAAMSVSTVANWGANFLVAATFLSLSTAITRQGTFYLYAGIAVLAFAFFAWKVPETKGRTLEEVQEELTSETPETAQTPGSAGSRV
jgi:sugar porter (SP) family MFS transporter